MSFDTRKNKTANANYCWVDYEAPDYRDSKEFKAYRKLVVAVVFELFAERKAPLVTYDISKGLKNDLIPKWTQDALETATEIEIIQGYIDRFRPRSVTKKRVRGMSSAEANSAPFAKNTGHNKNGVGTV